jgi:hypothetical protein
MQHTARQTAGVYGGGRLARNRLWIDRAVLITVLY